MIVPRELSPGRLYGIDVARGLAVLGMMAAHVGANTDFDFARPATWAGVTDGRSSILFATVAGISIALMSGRSAPVQGDELMRARLRILIRAVVIFALGGLLIMLQTGVGIILEFYAVMFALSLPFLRLRSGRLFELAAVFAVLAPLVNLLLIDALSTAPRVSAIVDLVVTGQYPVLVWLAFLFTGLGIGRLDLTSQRVRTRLVVVGGLLAVAGYGLGVLLGRVLGRLEDAEVVFTVEPHSGSVFEVIGSGGFAMAVIGLCLLAADRARWPLFPLEATGAMALTVYSLHIVAIALIGDEAFEQTDYGLYLGFLVVTLVAATLWRLTLGAGPFERLLATVARRATTTTVDSSAAPLRDGMPSGRSD
ncbi:acyltransferase family protein [Planctomonas deserti]|uniref:acyltransferase family protein n=1 Tax=Planctomonas deserti TaxID=2144185 RepID=UPI001F0C86BF|nr:acyltransferase family protein [Planctomonas deserti]